MQTSWCQKPFLNQRTWISLWWLRYVHRALSASAASCTHAFPLTSSAFWLFVIPQWFLGFVFALPLLWTNTCVTKLSYNFIIHVNWKHGKKVSRQRTRWACLVTDSLQWARRSYVHAYDAWHAGACRSQVVSAPAHCDGATSGNLKFK